MATGIPRTPSSIVRQLRYYIACIGDSLTNNFTLGVMASEFWPTALQDYLNTKSTTSIQDGTSTDRTTLGIGPGCLIRSRNWGISGNTTGPYSTATTTTTGTMTATTACPVTARNNFANGSTVIIADNTGHNYAMTTIASGGGTTGAGTLTLRDAVTATTGSSVIQVSAKAQDMITRYGLMLGSSTPVKQYPALFQYDAPDWAPPDLAVIFGGANDPGQSINQLNLNTTTSAASTQSGGPQPTPGYTTLMVPAGQAANATIGQAVVIYTGTLGNPTCQMWIGFVMGTGSANGTAGADTIVVSANPLCVDNIASSAFYKISQQHNQLPTLPPTNASVIQGTQANLTWMIHMMLAAQGAKLTIASADDSVYGNGNSQILLAATPPVWLQPGITVKLTGGTTEQVTIQKVNNLLVTTTTPITHTGHTALVGGGRVIVNSTQFRNFTDSSGDICTQVDTGSNGLNINALSGSLYLKAMDTLGTTGTGLVETDNGWLSVSWTGRSGSTGAGHLTGVTTSGSGNIVTNNDFVLTSGNPASYYSMRVAQQAAVAAFASCVYGQVVYNDLFSYQVDLINDARAFTFGANTYVFALADGVWHVGGTNQHLNAIGNAVIAMSMAVTISNQPGWITALST